MKQRRYHVVAINMHGRSYPLSESDDCGKKSKKRAFEVYQKAIEAGKPRISDGPYMVIACRDSWKMTETGYAEVWRIPV